MVGDRMRQKLSVGLSIFAFNLLCLNSFLYNNPKLCGFCHTLLPSPDLLVTAEEPRRQTRDTEMLLEATLAWTMSNVRFWSSYDHMGFVRVMRISWPIVNMQATMTAKPVKLLELFVRLMVCLYVYYTYMYFNIADLWYAPLYYLGSGGTGAVLTSNGELLFSMDLKVNFPLNNTNSNSTVNFTSIDGDNREEGESLARLEAGEFCLVQVQIVFKCTKWTCIMYIV